MLEERRIITHIVPIRSGVLSGIANVVLDAASQQSSLPNVDVQIVNALSNRASNVRGLEMIPLFRLPSVLLHLSTCQYPSVVLIHSVNYPQIMASAILCQLLRLPYGIVSHGSMSDLPKSPRSSSIRSIIVNYLRQRMIRGADFVQFLSEGEHKASTTSQVKRTIIIPNAVVVPTRGLAVRRDSARTMFLFLGRLAVHQKGLDLLLNAVLENAELLRRRRIRLLIVGPDEQPNSPVVLQMVKKLRLEDVIEVRPAIFGNEKENLLQETDLFLHTSRYEGEPTAVLEAMSYGIPVLVTRGTNMYDVVKDSDAGWVCETTHTSISEALRTAVLQLNKGPEKGCNGRSWVTKYRTPEIVLQAQMDLYFSSPLLDR